MPAMSTDDLQQIQTLLAHHERQIQDLSDIVMAQRKELDGLRARLQKTTQKLADIEGSRAETGGEGLSVSEQALRDKPPHY